MAEIKKTRGLVLRKLNYSNTSKIVTIFTEDYGKMAFFVKGGRSSKSKTGNLVDVLNMIEVVFYQKEGRDVQQLSQASLIAHFPMIKEDLEKIKYSSAIIELLNKLMLENEANHRLFRGVERILTLINKGENQPKYLFAKFFIFLLEELGYAIQNEKCADCHKELIPGRRTFYNYERGFVCEECAPDTIISFEFSAELFKLLSCLSNKNNNISYNDGDLEQIIKFLEKYLTWHVEDFKSINSLKML